MNAIHPQPFAVFTLAHKNLCLLEETESKGKTIDVMYSKTIKIMSFQEFACRYFARSAWYLYLQQIWMDFNSIMRQYEYWKEIIEDFLLAPEFAAVYLFFASLHLIHCCLSFHFFSLRLQSENGIFNFIDWDSETEKLKANMKRKSFQPNFSTGKKLFTFTEGRQKGFRKSLFHLRRNVLLF